MYTVELCLNPILWQARQTGNIYLLRDLSKLNTQFNSLVCSHSDFIQWKKRQQPSHQLLLKAKTLLERVILNDKPYLSSTLSKYAIPRLYDGRDKPPNTIKTGKMARRYRKWEKSGKISVEAMLKVNDKQLRLAFCCFTTSLFHPNHASQHREEYEWWGSYTYNDLYGESGICSVNRYNLLKCECYHCSTYGSGPWYQCKCPRCSDPVHGKDYVRKANRENATDRKFLS